MRSQIEKKTGGEIIDPATEQKQDDILTAIAALQDYLSTDGDELDPPPAAMGALQRIANLLYNLNYTYQNSGNYAAALTSIHNEIKLAYKPAIQVCWSAAIDSTENGKTLATLKGSAINEYAEVVRVRPNLSTEDIRYNMGNASATSAKLPVDGLVLHIANVETLKFFSTAGGNISVDELVGKP